MNEKSSNENGHILPRMSGNQKVDTKGVSNIYRVMLGKNNNILDEISQKWREKADLDLTSFLLSKSFRFIPEIDDI